MIDGGLDGLMVSPGVAPGGYLSVFQQCAAGGAQDGGVDTALFQEANLRFGRVDIDIEQSGIEFDVDDGDGVPPGEQQRVIRLFEGSGEHAAEHPAPVDKERNMLSRALVTGGKAGEATDYRSLGIFVAPIETTDGDHLFCHLQAINFDEDAGKLSIPWC